MTTTQLLEKEFDPYYGLYINKLDSKVQLVEGFEKGHTEVMRFFESIPEEKINYRYAANKWDSKEILQHLIDTERIFMYRCFRIARADKTPLAGFDQNIYISPRTTHDKTIDSLLNEFSSGRDATILMLESFTSADLANIGNANGGAMSARAAAFTIIGHEIWHMDIIKERYL